MSDSVKELALGERKFLHDMANQLVVAQGMGSIACSKVKKIEGVDPKIIERLEKTIVAVEKMTDMLRARREILLEVSED